MKNSRMELGERVKNLRRKQGMTLKELSKRAGVSVSLLSLIERNISAPTVRTLEKMAWIHWKVYEGKPSLIL